MKTGLIIAGGRVDPAFLKSFLCRSAGMPGGPDEAGSIGTDAARRQSAEENAGSDLPGFDCVIAADAGLEALSKLGIRPTAVVGDFDTVNPDVLSAYRRLPGILWDVHKPEKDETDTELAVSTAMKLGCTKLVILGATGGRLDHELSNIHLLKMCLDAGVDASLADEQNRLYLLASGKVFERDQVYGKYVSFIPMTEKVRGIRLSGFKYPLAGKDIAIGREAGLCVSNEIAEARAEIRFDEGILICVESRD